MKQIKQIITKEELITKFVNEYKWYHNVLTTKEYAIELSKRIAAILCVVFNLFLGFLPFFYGYVIESFMLVLCIVIIGAAADIEPDEIISDFENLKKKHDKFLELCDIVQTFVTNESDIATILNAKEVSDMSSWLRLLELNKVERQRL